MNLTLQRSVLSLFGCMAAWSPDRGDYKYFLADCLGRHGGFEYEY